MPTSPTLSDSARYASESGPAAARPSPATGRGKRDLVMLGFMITAILLFTATGSSVLIDVVRKTLGYPTALDPMLSSALILNIALIIFGWRRYSELSREVGERRRAEQRAFHLANTDPLTGCLNRRNVHTAAGGLIEAARARGKAVVAMMFDLDMFKRINDAYGHQTGDAVLVETTKRIRALLPEGSVMARLGGDEFACVVEMTPGNSDSIDNLAASIIEALSAPISTIKPNVEVTVSIGLASSQFLQIADPVACSEQLVHMADLAMYQAKKNGRNCYLWFEGGMASEMKYRADLERAIRQGIAHHEFVPYYEKQIDLATGELTGFEMLARWVSPGHEHIGPEVFIPVAEEIGVIAPMSEMLIAQALRDAREWDPRLTLSVNISPVQLRDPWFAQKLLKLLFEANFPPSRLDIEITETCLHENIGVVRSLVTSLKNQGVRVSLDDFGTGYSSLAQLRTLPFDQIKIDRSFVSSLGHNPDSETIVRAITSLGRGMNLPITAEGIESDEIAEQLKELGPFRGQGFLWGRPAPASDVHTLLAQHNLLAPGLATEPAETPAVDDTSTAARSA